MTIVVANEYYRFVATKVQPVLEEQTSLSIIRTADLLMRKGAELLKLHGLSPTQYNVLRILRGAGEDGASCKDVGARLVASDPDITRLMDRLEKRGLLVRDRAKEDRRVVTHRLTREGLNLVNVLDRPIQRMHREIMRNIEPERLKVLIAILEEVRIAI